MSRPKWDDEVARDVLGRHSAEDLFAKVYDRFLRYLGIKRQMLPLLLPDKPEEIETNDRVLRHAMRDESPLVPHLLDGARKVLALYRVHPEDGTLIIPSRVNIAITTQGGELKPVCGFDDGQVALQMDHLENLANNDLYVTVR